MIQPAVYLDYASSTPVDPLVIQVVAEALATTHGNVYAQHHAHGAAAVQAVQKARTQILDCLGASPTPEHQVIFTASSTESNNLALLGLIRHLKSRGKTHIVSSAIEHQSLLGPLQQMVQQGFRLTLLQPEQSGMLLAAQLEEVLAPDTGLVSIQAVNNEVGTVMPLAEMAAVLKGRGILFHTDAAQALGRIPFSVLDTGVDLVSISAHKTYGPQGIGALYAKGEAVSCLTPLFSGGGGMLRPGTVPVALCVGFGAACTLAHYSALEHARIQTLRGQFLATLQRAFPHLMVHGHPTANVPGILSFRIPGISHEQLVQALPSFSFGRGSSPGGEGFPPESLSHIIQLLSHSDQAPRETIRLSFGRFTTSDEMEAAAHAFVLAAQRQRPGVQLESV